MRLLAFVLLAMLSSVPSYVHACDDHDHGTAKADRSVGRESAWIAGVVRDVDVDDSTITLGHARIAALKMNAMDSMMFRVADSKVIAAARPGDKVRFRARLVNDQPTVTRLAPVRP